MASQRAKSKRHRMKKFLQDIVQPGGDRNTNTVSTSQPPDPSNSLSTGAQSIPPTPPTAASSGSKAASKLKKSGESAWTVLEATLRTFEKSTNVFPPLRAALGGVITCLDVVQAAAVNRKDYEELATEFQMVAETLKQCVGEFGSETPSPSIESMLLSIHTQIAHIKEKVTRDQAGRLIESTEEKEDIIKCYRKIETLFRQLQNDISLRTWKSVDKQRVETLLQTMSPANDARYNSSYSMTIKRRACTKETREQIQADLQAWACDPNAAKIYWMNGMAGTGKTTIAYSLCEWLEEEKQLAASFFCSRVSASCRDVSRIVPTIAYQLARYSAPYRSSLCTLLDSDPDASTLNVGQQLEKLIKKPLQQVQDAIPEDVVVVIDALDECENIHGVQLMLQTLLRDAEKLPLKFFVTSRPEPIIAQRMQSRDGYLPSVIHLHDIEQSIVEEDIKKYLTEALSLMSPLPSDDDILRLAKHSGKLFIYAATVARYICPEDTLVDSSDRLQTMLHINTKLVSDNEPSRKYDELNQLYTTVLTAALVTKLEQKETQTRQLVLWTIICLKETLDISALATLVGLTERQVSLAIQSLRAVLHLSDKTGLVSTLHASFPDYMLDQQRSGGFCCNVSHQSQRLAIDCFRVMRRQLRFNICNLNSSFIFDKDVPGLAKRIEESVSPVLSYACINWGEHLHLASFTEDLYAELVDFLSKRLLFWMEVLNLQQCGGTGGQALLKAQSWSQASAPTITQRLLTEAQQFVTQFFSNTCSRGTPHIYISMLPFYPKTSVIYETYRKQIHRLMDVKGESTDTIGRDAIARWDTNSPIAASALSPDGTRIVSGYSASPQNGGFVVHSCTLGVWDAHTGKVLVGPFWGHSKLGHWHVSSVAFSPDGMRIASASTAPFDPASVILIWDSYTGDTIADPILGHRGAVLSIAFSSDGAHIVSSSSEEHTVRVWDARTCVAVFEPLEGHEAKINSIAFSPDGMTIATGSDDCTIRLWGARSGNPISEAFKGHKSCVNSVSYSSDGTRIVSCSGRWNPFLEDLEFEMARDDGIELEPRPDSEGMDCTIRVWDALTGKAIAGPFENYPSPTYSVSFSPDDTCILFTSGSQDTICSSSDATITVLNAYTGEIVAGPFEGHEMPVTWAAFSPDGGRIYSTSRDHTIRVWDAHVGVITSKLYIGSKLSVCSVALSPDGTRIASGYDDHTVLVWDASTGSALAGPFKGHTDGVASIAFSPDGATIASGSWRGEVRIWDICASKSELVSPHTGGRGCVSSIAFSPDGRTLVWGCHDSTIQLWSIETRRFVIGPLEGHDDRVTSVSFSPDDVTIASGSEDGTIRVWDTLTGNMVSGPFGEHSSSIHSVAFSPDGLRIASSSRNKSHDSFGGVGNCIRVWNAGTGETVAGPFTGYKEIIRSITFSPNGKHIISGYGQLMMDGLKHWVSSGIRVLDADTGSTIAGPFDGHAGEVVTVAISSDGMRIASGSQSTSTDTGYIRLINYHKQRELQPIFHGSWSFNPDGWITNKGVPVFWVHPDLHSYIQRPEETLVIGHCGLMQIDYEDLAIGERWSECYAPC